MKTLLLIGLGTVLCLKTAFAADANLPKTAAELNAWYVEPPAGGNAATFYLKGFDTLRITDADTGSPNLPILGKGQLPTPDKLVPPTMKTTISALIERNKGAISQFEQGAKFDKSRYPIDLAAGSATLLPHLAKIKRGEQVLQLAALSDAITGQGKKAGDDLLMSLALDESLKSEPTLISQLVRIACESITISSFEQVVNRIALPGGSLDQLQKAFGRAEQNASAGASLQSAIVGERVMGTSAFDMKPEALIDLVTSSSPGDSREIVADKIKKTRDADRKFLEAAYDEVLTAVKQDYPERLKAGGIFDRHAAEAKNREFLVSAITLPSLGKAFSRDATGLAHLRLAQTAVALEQFRTLHDNRYPDSLSLLTPTHLPAVPKDPFNGQPLKYRKAGSGYVLYSIGSDLKDDSGRAGKSTDGDIVFTVVNSPKLTQ